MEWSHGVAYWSEVLEWTGTKSDFEFFDVPHFFIIFTVYTGDIK